MPSLYFSGLPPVIFSASDTEVLLDDSEMLYEKLKKQGHQTALDIRHGACHAFQVFTAMPEAQQILDVIFRVLEKWACYAAVDGNRWWLRHPFSAIFARGNGENDVLSR